jgi:hypothetical protein
MANAGLVLLEAEVDAAVNADLWPETHTLADVALVELNSDVAVVQVDLPAAEGQPALRQTRVYRRSEAGWVRTAPSAATWGPRRRLETDYFVFHYDEQDREAVKAAAAKLDALYPSLYAAFFPGVPGGKLLLPPSIPVENVFFPGAPNGEKQVVQVDPLQMPGKLAKRAANQDRFVVAAPAAYLAPVDISQADLLAQSVVLALLEDFKAQVSQRFAHEPYLTDHVKRLRISRLPYAVLLWQLWATDLPLAAWRKPVVEWVFDPEGARPAGDIPAFAPALCAMHRLWLGWPYQIRVPMICDNQGQPVPSDFWCTPRMAALRLADLTVSDYSSTRRPPADARLGIEVALATVVEYAAAAYGPARIPVLIENFSRHEQWATLIPAVFGVPAAEFAAGWQAYLAEHYGVQL